jgi:hypothetical protein
VELYRAEISCRLEKGEKILTEHHVVSAHFRFTQSVLHESNEMAQSLFATGERLYCLRSTIVPYRPPTCDENDQTSISSIPYSNIRRLRTHREIRTGEILAGFLISSIGCVFYPWLLFTGKIMIALGILGAVHGLLLPTRHIELDCDDPGSEGPIKIFALRKKSGRHLVRLLRAKLAARG